MLRSEGSNGRELLLQPAIPPRQAPHPQLAWTVVDGDLDHRVEPGVPLGLRKYDDRLFGIVRLSPGELGDPSIFLSEPGELVPQVASGHEAEVGVAEQGRCCTRERR